jgi:tellurite resistance protein TerC
MLVTKAEDVSFNPDKTISFAKRFFKLTSNIEGKHFFIKQIDPATGRLARYATPLFLALLVIEFADLIFAIDSVPAIFAITTDPYIVYTSNIFAILGLRSLYFALAVVIDRFKYLNYALALILIFISSKVFIVGIFDIKKFPASISLGVTIALLAGGILFSLQKTKKR